MYGATIKINWQQLEQAFIATIYLLKVLILFELQLWTHLCIV